MTAVPLRLTVVIDYDGEPEHYGLTPDGGPLTPTDMARIDKENIDRDPTVILDLMESHPTTTTVTPVT